MGNYSRALPQTEKNYAATEIECLDIMRKVDYFDIHLLGQPFTIFTDYKPLKTLHSSGKLNAHLLKWALALQTNNFKVKYRLGLIHQNADSISWQV